MPSLYTKRLELRHLTQEDSAFMLELVNTPGWLEFIGDKGIRNLHAAKTYIQEGPMASYQLRGFGLFAVCDLATKKALGVCGLVKREPLAFPDLGFAFLPAQVGQGFAYEACQAVLNHALTVLQLPTIYAVTTLHNQRSINLLAKLGFHLEKQMRLSPSSEELNLYKKTLQPG